MLAHSYVPYVQARAIRSAIGKAVIGAECDRVPHPSGTSSQHNSNSVASDHIGCRQTSERNSGSNGGGRFGLITSSTASLSSSSCISSPLSPGSTSSSIGRDVSASLFGSLPISSHTGEHGQKADHGVTTAACHSDGSGTGSDVGSLKRSNSSSTALHSPKLSSEHSLLPEHEHKEAFSQPRSINFADGVGSSSRADSREILEGDHARATSGAANVLLDNHKVDRGKPRLLWQYHRSMLQWTHGSRRHCMCVRGIFAVGWG